VTASPRRAAGKCLALIAVASSLGWSTQALAHGHRHGRLIAASSSSIYQGEPKSTAIVMDARSGEVLFSERADSPRYPASVTKLMTMYLALDALSSGRLQMSDQIVVSPLAASQPPTKLGLRAGDVISVDDALHAMMVHSANDMAMAVAERIGGSSSRFADLMTLKARQLGMTNTRYVNPNGLPDSRQISTAHDVAVLARAIIRDFPQYYYLFGQEQFTYRGHTMVNTNHLLGKMPGVDGLKTGFTNAAGFNLAASAMRNGHRLIAVVMGSPSGQTRNSDVENLLLTGFDVEDRRDRGERIIATQTLFESSPGLIAHGWAKAGTASDPIDVVLTRNTTTTTQPMTVAAAMPPPSQTRERHNWSVQLGVFKTQHAAQIQVASAARRFGEFFSRAEGLVDGARGAYRARFAGMTETAAKDACSTVRDHGMTCVVNGRA